MKNRYGWTRPQAGTKISSLAIRAHRSPAIQRSASSAMQITMIVMVTTGVDPRLTPPNTVRTCGRAAAAALAQSTQWNPTVAGRWHSPQAGRPHRWHRAYAARSGCRGQTDTPGA